MIPDLHAFEAKITRTTGPARDMGVALRAHGKMRKSSAVALRQMEISGALGLCCQQTSEAEAFARDGVRDALVTNQVREPSKIDCLARLAGHAALAVCVDDVGNAADLSAAADRHGTQIEALAEIDRRAGRCGLATPTEAVAIARTIAAAPGLGFGGFQAYNGCAQQLRSYADRVVVIDAVRALVLMPMAALEDAGLECPKVTGAGIASFELWGLWPLHRNSVRLLCLHGCGVLPGHGS